MASRALVRGIRIDSGASAVEVALEPGSGGRHVKRVAYALTRKDASNTTDQLDLKIEHSVDGYLWVDHTAYVGLADIGDMLVIESDADVILGEFYRLKIKTAASAGQWFVLDVHEITRRF